MIAPPTRVVAYPASNKVARLKLAIRALIDEGIRMLDYIDVLVYHLRDINTIFTHSFQIPVDDILVMEILNAMCDIKSLEKAIITNAIPQLLPKKHNW